ncbi:MAG: NAD-dependent deacetylase [Pseudomonadota bacterium]|nr:NAD-dependent deacetylase [Pseudomonadota bacterium]
MNDAVEKVQHWLRAAQQVVALTGAGISTESGIADFRGPDGVWTRNPEAEKLAAIDTYLADPEVRRRAWRRRLENAWQPLPNAGHHALVALERQGRLHTLITQNVDGLHLEAGTSPQRLIEIHGSLRQVSCLDCGIRSPMAAVLERVRAGEADPPCLDCGGILKSATVSFGQRLDRKDLSRAERAARSCDLLLAIGSTLSVLPVAGIVPLARQSGARVIIINAEPTAMDAMANVVIRGPIGAVLPWLVAGVAEPESRSVH